jgi:hypothetical protein
MSKINPYDLPPEKERSVRIVLSNIEWDATPQAGVVFPQTISVPVDSNLPEEQMIAKAMDAASAATGFCIVDCDVEPIVYSNYSTDRAEAEVVQAAFAKIQDAFRKKYGDDYSAEDNLDGLLAKATKIAESEENGIYSDAFLEALKAGEDPNNPLNQWDKDESVSDSTLEYAGDIYTNDT